MQYYSTVKRNEQSSHEKTWGNLQCMLPRERSQTEKATYCMIPTTWHSGKDKTMKTIERSVIARGLGIEMNRWSKDW